MRGGLWLAAFAAVLCVVNVIGDLYLGEVFGAIGFAAAAVGWVAAVLWCRSARRWQLAAEAWQTVLTRCPVCGSGHNVPSTEAGGRICEGCGCLFGPGGVTGPPDPERLHERRQVEGWRR